MAEETRASRWEHQLRRIEVLTDVVFAVILVRIFVLLPKPTRADLKADGLLAFYEDQIGAFAIVLVGFVVTLIYWLQNNAVMGLLRRTDTRHTVMAVIQLVAILLFLYAIRIGLDFEGDRFAMILESTMAALMGFLGWGNWAYAARDRKLLHDWVEEGDVQRMTFRLLPEPITAVLTIPCAFIGPEAWGLSWFVIGPAVAWIVRRLRR
ncbi:MAG: TMEM175 family protein [Planctomycetota bacterium]